eukprot:1589098-Prorocentrum_lima.AAC.1
MKSTVVNTDTHPGCGAIRHLDSQIRSFRVDYLVKYDIGSRYSDVIKDTRFSFDTSIIGEPESSDTVS